MIYDYGKECRKRQKITQKQMADMIGVPQSSIARLEKGEGDVQLSTILNYLSPLGLTLEVRSKDVPNKTTLRAMYEKDSKKSFNSMDELLADLNS
ncbi:MAG: helix-turn-helix transcriptional regulator [Firmicutes bacterium]|nr:helix-turn-helix transcriptional regulator [Candidatus Fiminaster equi]